MKTLQVPIDPIGTIEWHIDGERGRLFGSTKLNVRSALAQTGHVPART
ncbi:hypothetical protein [Lysobacter sp. CW239]|nr:hypothetical protein [Lysobacter sp. CW239]